MLKLILLISILVVVAFSEEADETLSRERRFSPYGFGFPFTYAGPHGAYAGAAAGASPYYYGGPPAWTYPQRSFFPFNWMPFPMFPFPQNWYEGENVCKEVKTRDDTTPDEFSEWLKDEDSPSINSDYSHESESCKGSNTKYVCIKRISDGSGKTKLQATKYECCHGFVRNPNGPGCVENAPQSSPPAAPEAAPGKPIDKYYYGYGPNDKYSQKSASSSSSSSSVSKSVGKVPVQ